MMRFLLGAVLITLQLCVSGSRAQDQDEVIACYTYCRESLQDSVEGWSCDGNAECNCNTKGYLSRLGCCMLDRCEVDNTGAVFNIPCTPEDGGDIEYAEASCKASDRTSTKTTETADATSTGDGGSMGANNVSQTPDASSTTRETSSSSSRATSTSGPEETGPGEAPNSDESTTTGDDSNGSNNTLALGLGLGLGIPLALIIIGLAAFLVYRKRKRNNHNNNTHHHHDKRDIDDPRQATDPKMNPFASPSPPPNDDSPVYEMFSPTGADGDDDDDDVPPLAPSLFNDSASAKMSELSAGDVPGPTTAATRTMTKKGRLSELAAGEITVPRSSRHKNQKSQSSIKSRPSQDRHSQAASHHSGGAAAASASAASSPRNWDSRSTLVASAVAGPAEPRGTSTRPSASISSRTSEMLMRDLPSLPPEAKTRTTPGQVSELP